MSPKNKVIVEVINDTIVQLMERVMKKVLIEDPFLSDNHKAKKPLYAALVPDEIFKGSHFERRFVTPFGGVWEKLAKSAAQKYYGNAVLSKAITGKIPKERLRRIQEVLNNLEHAEVGKKKIKPNWDKELDYILEGKGKLIPATVVCDLFVENNKDKKSYAFELKSPLPNSDISKVSKEKMFKLYSMSPLMVSDAFFALPYNPFGKRENYSWAFPERWFNMKEDKNVLIGNEFWDLIGGKNTYETFITEINKVGGHYRERIYREYLGIEPPASSSSHKLIL
ncbi:MAG: TdeIII family type II restriction endonuclease [Bacteroidota bacterium]|nr:TdeIII family type II restriction endonuclease [Bacteroidota bacterium]